MICYLSRNISHRKTSLQGFQYIQNTENLLTKRTFDLLMRVFANEKSVRPRKCMRLVQSSHSFYREVKMAVLLNIFLYL